MQQDLKDHRDRKGLREARATRHTRRKSRRISRQVYLRLAPVWRRVMGAHGRATQVGMRSMLSPAVQKYQMVVPVALG